MLLCSAFHLLLLCLFFSSPHLLSLSLISATSLLPRIHASWSTAGWRKRKGETETEREEVTCISGVGTVCKLPCKLKSREMHLQGQQSKCTCERSCSAVWVIIILMIVLLHKRVSGNTTNSYKKQLQYLLSSLLVCFWYCFRVLNESNMYVVIIYPSGIHSNTNTRNKEALEAQWPIALYDCRTLPSSLNSPNLATNIFWYFVQLSICVRFRSIIQETRWNI